MTKNKRADAANAFAEFKAQKQAERELDEHQFTLEEVQQLRAESGDGGDGGDGAKRWIALQQAVKRSNERGDYKETWQMSPKEYAEYHGFGNKPVYSLADMDAIIASVGGNRYETVNDPLPQAWLSEFKAAQRERRIMMGPGGGKDRRVFDESEQARAQRLEGYGALMHLSVKTRDLLKKAARQTQELLGADADKEVIMSHILNSASAIAPHVRQIAGLPFDARKSDEFAEFNRQVETAGGLRSWKFDDA